MMFPEINVRVIPGIVCNNRGAMYRALKSTPSNFCAKKSCIQTEGEERRSSPILYSPFLRMPRRSK